MSMMMTLQQAAQILDAQLFGVGDVGFESVSTDGRSIKTGELFVALKGPNFDAHNFIAQARESGAVAAIVDHKIEDALPQLVVTDTRLALGQLAAAWRKEFKGAVIGITGSNGKTTVKEMLAAIFSQQGKVLATEGNLNNDIGLPLTLLRLRPEDHQFAVIEMGANHLGEIAYLAGLTQPDVAVITNAAAAHLEGFGSLEDIARAKGEIWQGLKEGGIAVINADDQFSGNWRELSADHEGLSFGFLPSADVCLGEGGVRWSQEGALFKSCFQIKTAKGCIEVALNLAGQHNVINALAATAAALAVGVELNDIQAGLNSVQPVNGRLQPKVASTGQLVIDDTYNANPQSLNAAVEVLCQTGSETVLVLGDMAELGDEAASLHFQAGERARHRGVSRLYAIGLHSRGAVQAFGVDGVWFETQDELIGALHELLGMPEHKEAALLIKGSRSSAMERVVNALVGESIKGGGHGSSIGQPQAAYRMGSV